MLFSLRQQPQGSSLIANKGENMSHTSLRRWFRPLIPLLLVIAALVSPSLDRRAIADENCCIDQHAACFTNCGSDTACQQTCNDQYSICAASGGDTCLPQSPNTPCQECLDNCDQMYVSCVAEITKPIQECAFIRYRCKQRCNILCIY